MWTHLWVRAWGLGLRTGGRRRAATKGRLSALGSGVDAFMDLLAAVQPHGLRRPPPALLREVCGRQGHLCRQPPHARSDGRALDQLASLSAAAHFLLVQ